MLGVTIWSSRIGWRIIKSCHPRNYSIDFKLKDQKKVTKAMDSLVHKDITVFVHDNPSVVRWKLYLGAAMFPVWSFLSYSAFSLKKQLGPVEKTSSNKWFLENIFTVATTVSVGFFCFGVWLSSYWISRSLNTVNRIILRKGGKYVSFVTYGFLPNRSKFITVPIHHCSSVRRDFQKDQRMFLELKHKTFKYQLDLQEGVFYNRPLFEKCLGVKRHFK